MNKKSILFLVIILTIGLIGVLPIKAEPVTIKSFTLVNASTNKDIMKLANGTIIDFKSIGTKDLNIRADINTGVKSVLFNLNNKDVRVESTPPFTMAGDNNGDYNIWQPQIGNYIIKATPYSEKNATGTKGTALTINFSVIDNNNPNPDPNSKPLVWIFTDMSDKNIKNSKGEPVNDPDDISTMAAYALMSNEFNTLGIVVSSTHRSELKNSPDQAVWANNHIGNAYKEELNNLNKNIGGYQSSLPFIESSIKKTAHHFQKTNDYKDLKDFSSVQALVDAVKKADGIVNVLNWGSTTELAIFAKHCESTGRTDLLKKIRIISHWTNSPLHQGTVTNPDNVANCKEDKDACAYLKSLAKDRKTDYYECGAIGQHGIVSGSPKGESYFNPFKVSKLGTRFVEGKYVYNSVDFSDSATFYVLLGNYGVSLKDIKPDGTNSESIERSNENKFKQNSKKIHDELLRRAKAAANK